MSPIALIDLRISRGQIFQRSADQEGAVQDGKTYLSMDNCFGNNRPWAVFDFFSLLAMIKSHNAALS